MKRFHNILVAVDTRFEEQPALQWSEQIVKNNQAKLKIIDIVPDYSWLTRKIMPDAQQTQQVLAKEKQRKLEAIAEPIRDQGIDVSTKVLFGKTSFEIMYEVIRSQHDLVVRVTKGAKSHEGSGFFGTTSKRLLRKCPCAVWLVRPDAPTDFSRVLAAIDPKPDDFENDPMNKTIMELGTSVSKYNNGELQIVHSWKVYGLSALKSRLKPGELKKIQQKAESEVNIVLDDFLGHYELTHRSDNVHLLPEELGYGIAITDLAKQKNIDLIVMGTVARAGVAGALMGNTAERVLNNVECSVLAIKPDDFVSPVTLKDE